MNYCTICQCSLDNCTGEGGLCKHCTNARQAGVAEGERRERERICIWLEGADDPEEHPYGKREADMIRAGAHANSSESPNSSEPTNG